MHRICQRNPNNSEFDFTLMKTKIGPISMSNFHGNILSRETGPLTHCSALWGQALSEGELSCSCIYIF